MQPHGLWPTRLLWSWDFPGKNTGWVAISFSRGSSWLRDQTCVSWIGMRILYLWATREAHNIIRRKKMLWTWKGTCKWRHNTNASEPTQELILDEKVRWRVQQKKRGRRSSGMERQTKSPSERQIPVLNWKMLTGLVDQNTAIGKLKKGSLKWEEWKMES